MVTTVSAIPPLDSGRLLEPRRGNRAALRSVRERGAIVEVLYARHRKLLLSYLCHLAPTREDAEEAVQEAYLRLLDAPRLDDCEPRLRSYLFTTGRNLVSDLFRRRQARRVHLNVDIESLDVQSPEPNPDTTAELHDRLAILEAALSESLPRARRAFELHFDAQQSYACIAETLGISRKTVERDIAMVLALCRERLEAREACPPDRN